VLLFVGTRRPGELTDQGRYAETVSRPAAAPVAHDDPLSVTGHHVGNGVGRYAYAGRHRRVR